MEKITLKAVRTSSAPDSKGKFQYNGYSDTAKKLSRFSIVSPLNVETPLFIGIEITEIDANQFDKKG